jgi:hypothetical protein
MEVREACSTVVGSPGLRTDFHVPRIRQSGRGLSSSSNPTMRVG